MRTPTRAVLCQGLALLALVLSTADARGQEATRGESLFRQVDRDSDGRITPEEFGNAKAFEALDTDGDGSITREEAFAAVAAMTPEERAELGAAIEAELEARDATATGGPVETAHRACYSKDLRIHVGVLGVSDGEPLTEGDDFKPVWSKTGDKLVFFRRVVDHRETSMWKTAICVMGADGEGFHRLSDGTHTDFNPTWTRDGTNVPIWNRQKAEGGGYVVMASRIGGKPGEEHPVSDASFTTWAFACLADGRMLVSAAPPQQGRGYYLMRPRSDGRPTYERVDCELGRTGILDRISISPSETLVCFEHQSGFGQSMTGRALYLADFDPAKRTITNARPFANEEHKPVWFAYPRWTKDGTAIVYHAGGVLFLYTLEDGKTVRVSTDDGAKYSYPHGEATPN